MQAMPLQTFKKVILGGPRGTRQKNFRIETQQVSWASTIQV
jgi:hypothetical protein